MSDDIFAINPDTQNQTEWSSNFATLYRVDSLLRKAATHSINGELDGWYKTLESLKREAIVKMKHTTPSEQAPHCIETTSKLFCVRCACENMFSTMKTRYTLLGKSAKSTQMLQMFERDLDRAEIFIRDFMDKKGMLLRDSKTGMEKFRGV